ncbi:glycosyltransferase family 39 protein [Polyangium spumosum]|uniref:Glycosyltransferase RgtA/B/C/D-like domain-containing protein n=1 Tax=Polyangium spumosum TaxID=889282 RepID=A0A6N7PNC8_9BACT|nr:glycosyltransferase family 39 protein [Polyangium spumosum]MRG93518.1 hypothetical protein [Polyangium spumosum]
MKRTPEGQERDSDADAEAEAEEADADDDRGEPDPDAADPPWRRPPAETLRDWLAGAPLPRPVHLVLGLVLPAVVLLVNAGRVLSFTIDDAYISYRYARNLARGLGLVYNAGERIEGYTNFLWTVILAGAIKIGLDPDVTAKVLGAGSALGALVMMYRLSDRLRPLAAAPCLATWLAATTVVFSGYAVFGLETAFFVFLLLAGTWLFLREIEPGSTRALPWSGLVFGLAGITRPEAPAFVGLLMLVLLFGRETFGTKNGLLHVLRAPGGFFGKQNLLRGAAFVLPVGAHLAFRRAYYGTFVPNTFSAKTGNWSAQLDGGSAYVRDYVFHAGPVLYLGIFAIAIGLVARRRDLLAVSAIALFVLGYVIAVGGDWMPFYRFMAPFEPFAFLLVCVSARVIVDRRSQAANVALAAFLTVAFSLRIGNMHVAQRQIVEKEERFWKMAAGGTTKWLLENGQPGEIAIGDIGYVGYATDYPILDLLGLVDPVISKLEGGYTRKLGPGFTDRLFDKRPPYVLIISSNIDCKHPSVPGSQVIYRDRRFLPAYEIAGRVPLDAGFAWCIYRRKSTPGTRAP